MTRNAIRLAAALSACGAACGFGPLSAPAQAQGYAGAQEYGQARIRHRSAYGRSHRAVDRAPASSPAGRFFVDFRARYALSYGHTYVAYGRLDSRGQIIESHVAGLHPAGDSSVPWMIGHLIFVPSETGPSDGDLEAKYIAASYRVTMDEARYDEMVSYIKQLQATSPAWNAVLYNCNTFAGRIANHVGLKAPAVTVVYPANYINAMRSMNGGRSTLSPSQT